MKTRLFHLHALSALHCGTGQSAGVVDLPIARAKATKLPMVPGSSLRGVLRDEVAREDVATLFGPRLDLRRAVVDAASTDGDANSFAGACAVGDATLLTLPVRCLAGVVCYATSPFILSRYARDISWYARDLCRAGLQVPDVVDPGQSQVAVPKQSVNLVQGKVVLEDLDLTAREDATAEQWAKMLASVAYPDNDDKDAREDFTSRFAILPDDVMDFLSETGTEVRARIAVDPTTGTVKGTALWHEENLPAESLLWGVFAVTASLRKDDQRGEDDLAKAVPSDRLLQLGGKAGVGRGLVRFLASEVGA